jgi:optic atrophy 3 protein
MGANFAAETFIFAVGIGVIVFEQWRQRRKARNARDDIREDLEEMQAELKAVKVELEEMKARHPEPAPSGRLLGFLRGSGKTDEKKDSRQAVDTQLKTDASATSQFATGDPTNTSHAVVAKEQE